MRQLRETQEEIINNSGGEKNSGGGKNRDCGKCERVRMHAHEVPSFFWL